MEVFRICKETYATKLTSSGSANRWNLRGQQVIYAGASRSLSSLELVVHKGSVVPTMPYKVMVISIADDDYLIKQLQIKELPVKWREFSAYSTLQKIGSGWYNSHETLVLKVPSAIIPYEYNYVVNAEHAAFTDKIHLVRTEEYFWDSRLF